MLRPYREALLHRDPNECAHIDAIARRRNQGWAVPQPATYEPDDLLTVELLADYCYVKPRTVDEWVRRGLKVTETPDGNRFRIGDVWNFQAGQRRRRAKPRGSSTKGTTVVPSDRLNTSVPAGLLPLTRG